MMCTSCLNHIQDTKQSIDYKGHNICIHCILDDDVDKGQLRASIDAETRCPFDEPLHNHHDGCPSCYIEGCR